MLLPWSNEKGGRSLRSGRNPPTLPLPRSEKEGEEKKYRALTLKLRRKVKKSIGGGPILYRRTLSEAISSERRNEGKKRYLLFHYPEGPRER